MPVVDFGSGGAGVPLLGKSLPILDGRQFEIHWLGADAQSIPAEFGGHLPEPGKGFVSPALIEAAGGPGGFQERFGIEVDEHNRDVRWEHVTAFAGEFLAFATVPEGRPPSVGASAGPQQSLVGFDAEELGASVASGPFEMPSGLVTIPHSLDERVPTPAAAQSGAMFGLLLPGLLVLGIGLSARSALRTQRSDALVYLGAGPNAQDAFDASEAATLSVPIALIVSAVMWGILGVPTSLPFGSIEYLSGDLRPSAGIAVVALLIALLVPVAVGALTPKVTAWRAQRNKRTIRWTGRLLLLVPVAVSVATTQFPPQLRALRLVVVLASVVAVVPTVAVAVLPVVGAILTAPDRVARLVAGRRFQRGDQRGSDLIRITTLTVVAAVVLTSMSLASYAGALESEGPPGIMTVSADSEIDGPTFAEFAMQFPNVPFATVVDGQVFVANCEELAVPAGPGSQGCSTDPERFMNEVERSTAVRPGVFVLGSPPLDRPVVQMIARVDSASQAHALEADANAIFGPSSVSGWDRLGPNPIIGWVQPLGVSALALFGVAVVLLLVNTIRFPSQSDQALAWLAAPIRTRRAVLRWGFHSAVWVGVLLGCGYGIVAVTAGQPSGITELDYLSLANSAILCGAATSVVIEAALWAHGRQQVGVPAGAESVDIY
ncbi:hypothetical protein [Candidatus Microthrix parvicella]|uniref:hypothetical protein n=1 Tax=Candidatus Neomicrothrix parvicella TaxID=41950 RepID=UPI00038018DA|nr:hypothetical protein [Candidatus Microthrix parvicella]